MTPRALLILALLTAAVGAAPRHAAAQAPAPAAGDIDPVGTYELSLSVQGAAISSTIKVEKGSDAAFSGTVTTEAYGTFRIASLKVSGSTITIGISTQDGSPVTISLVLDGNQVTGEWTMANDGSRITGKKLPSA